MIKERIKLLIGLLLAITATVLTLIWYDWKLLLIIFIFTWSNSISITHVANRKTKEVFEIIKAMLR